MIRGLISQEFELESLGMLQWSEREWRARAGRRAVFLAGGGMGCISSLPTAILIFLETVSAALPRSGISMSESGIATLPGNSGNRNFVA
jgi:hypothetical protein